jgi:hypothetical protein
MNEFEKRAVMCEAYLAVVLAALTTVASEPTIANVMAEAMAAANKARDDRRRAERPCG